MPAGLLWLHPALQALATCLAVYAAFLGLKRFRANHFGRKVLFPWKRHVRLGALTYLLWTLGMVGGFAMTALFWKGPFVFDDHYGPALVLLGCMIVGYATGLRMDRRKGESKKVLPLVHAAANATALYLAADLAVTGVDAIRNFLL